MKLKYLSILSLAFLCSCGDRNEVLDADEIARDWNEVLSEHYSEMIVNSASLFEFKGDWHGVLKKDGKETPISLFYRDENIQLVYGAKRDKRFHIRQKQGQLEFFEIKNGKTFKFEENKISEKIEGSDLSFEDLRMGLGRWNKPINLR